MPESDIIKLFNQSTKLRLTGDWWIPLTWDADGENVMKSSRNIDYNFHNICVYSPLVPGARHKTDRGRRSRDGLQSISVHVVPRVRLHAELRFQREPE